MADMRDFSKAVTLPNGDLWFPPDEAYERADTIEAPAPLPESEQTSDAEAQRFATARPRRTNFELVQDAIAEASEG